MYSREILLERAQLALFRALWAFFAVYLSVWIWHRGIRGQDFTPWGIYVVPGVVIAAMLAVVMWNTPAVNPESPRVGAALSILKAIVIVVLVAVAISFFYRADSYSRGTLVAFLPIVFAALVGAGATHLVVLRTISSSAYASRRVVIVGMGDYGIRIARTLLRQPGYYDVVGYVDDPRIQTTAVPPIRCLGSIDDLGVVLDEEEIDVAMIALSEHGDEQNQSTIGVCMAAGVDWKIVPPMLDLLPHMVDFEYVGGLPLLGQRRSRLVGYNWYLKRSFDLVTSAILVLLLFPFLLLTWIAVKTTSPGPAIFRQQRVGLHGELFTLLKFRTMRVDASSLRHQEATANWIVGNTINGEIDDDNVHKITHDDRITSVGRFLRATSVDELPQLFNVLKGEMSLVGPRPPIEYEVARYSEGHKRRFDVPPGVTGLWQVSGRNRLSFDDMVELDISYIEQWTLALDVEILLRTIPAVVSDHGY